MFGNERNLREVARRYTLKQRVADDPCLVTFSRAVADWGWKAKESRDKEAKELSALGAWVRR